MDTRNKIVKPLFHAGLLLSIMAALYSCSNQGVCPEVNSYGALSNVMKKNDLSAHVHLSELKNKEGLYALGALENLEGEITIINGNPYISTANNPHIDISNSWEKSAAFLVYSEVNQWFEHELPKHIKSRVDLEGYLKTMAEKCNGPFPFMLEGVASSFSWHVIKWDLNDSIHTHEKHQKSGAYGTWINEPVTVLGFYSDAHAGIYTHHSSNIHMHVRTLDNRVAAHLDNLLIGEKMRLKLPFSHE